MFQDGKAGKCALIVGSGPSAQAVIDNPEILQRQTVIAVNGVIDWIDQADIWFSLDHSDVNLSRANHQRLGTIYHAAGDGFKDCPVRLWQRHAERSEEPQEKDSPEWWIWRWSAVKGLSTTPDVINSGNSAYGALGLAYHLGYEHVALIGVDGTSAPRLDGTGSPRNLSHLPLLFFSASQQIDVTSCGELSGITRMSISEWQSKYLE